MATTMLVLVNGILVEPFQPERGIKQGDPISPYIFIICTEYLGKYTHFMANVFKSGISIKIAKTGPIISNLTFADDCMIFCNASISAARNIKTILENYYYVSEQLVNYHNSMIQFSKKIIKTKV